MSTPVTPFTSVGMHCMMLSTSPVSFAAPTSLPPQDTMVTLLTCDSGAATSAATCYGKNSPNEYYYNIHNNYTLYWSGNKIQTKLLVNRTLGKVSSIISTMAADPYSFQASAFLAICSASAAALALIA